LKTINENPEETENRKKKSNVFVDSGKYLSLGLETFLPIVLGALAGNLWLDKVYNTTPLWTVILALFGFVAGMYNLFKTVIMINKESGKRK
jgi:F0F1-type ATP synthase assembly protein I